MNEEDILEGTVVDKGDVLYPVNVVDSTPAPPVATPYSVPSEDGKTVRFFINPDGNSLLTHEDIEGEQVWGSGTNES